MEVTMSDAGSAVRRSTQLSDPPEAVWGAITGSAELAAWFGASAEVDARPGGAVRFRWPDGGERRGIVEAVDAPHRFAFRWRAITRTPGGVRVEEVSRVEFLLEPVGAGTRLTVTEEPGMLPTEAIGRRSSSAPAGRSNDLQLLAAP
jgi:uncharacterized protein YndB with AHSA1/START domain